MCALLKTKNNIQFVKFALIGLLNTAVHYAVFIACYRIININLIMATTIGYCAGMLNSFLMNRSWTFQMSGRFKFSEFYRFVAVNLVALIVNSLSLYFFVAVCGIVEEVSQIVAIVFSLLINYIGNKFWTFNDQ